MVIKGQVDIYIKLVQLKMCKPSELEKMLYQRHKIMLVKQIKMYKTYGYRGYRIKMYNPNGVWEPHPYTCRLHFSFFLHQKYKFGPLNSLRSTNTRHIEIGPNFMLLAPHLYKIPLPAISIFTLGRTPIFLLDLALGPRNMRYFHFKFHFRKVIFNS